MVNLILLFSLFIFITPYISSAQTCPDSDNDGYADIICGGTDCDDTETTVYPGAPVLCDGLDNNCDGWRDYYTDRDEDLDGVFWCAGDCDDNDPNRSPNIQEGPYLDLTCSDGIDNDCDGYTDASDSQCSSFCSDNDRDGYGFPGSGDCPNGNATDCNDNNSSINPGAPDAICDGIDDNCSGTADDEYTTAGTSCGNCQGGVEVDTCAPLAPQHEGPLGDITCSDGIDNDCDLDTDGFDFDCTIACIDIDGDGYGANGVDDCTIGTAIEIDCNDNDSNINPGAYCNGIDEDCSSVADDGYIVTATSCGVGECGSNGQLECISGVEVNSCTEGTPDIEGPSTDPTCSDGLDNDCDGLIDEVIGIQDPDCSSFDVDDDRDGFTENQGDCNDTNDTVYPGAPILCDGLDNNCDGWQDYPTDVDKDNDGVPWCAGDCDDNDPTRSPNAQEGPYLDPTCSDGIDNDCDSYVDIDSECAAPTCDIKFAPQDGPHFWDLLDPADDSLLKRNCDWCHLDDTGTIDERNECQRCHADINDTSDPLNGVLKDHYPLAPPYGFGIALNVKVHSSSEVGNKYGNWDMNCMTCHNPHMQEQDNRYGTSYGKLIKEFICFDNPVTGLNVEEIIELTSATGDGSFADGPPHNENICEMCHTQTNYHRNDGSTTVHNDNADCIDCHLHSDGFQPVARSPHNTDLFNSNCDLCHVYIQGVIDFIATIPNQKCNNCHGERKAHTSSPLSNPLASGNYVYDILCVDCHDPMLSVGNNRKLIRQSISMSVIPGSLILSTTKWQTGSLADSAPRNENICETCHSLTNHNRGDGTGNGIHLDNIDYDGFYCMICHDHDTSFMTRGKTCVEENYPGISCTP
jgi:hypothetical protein